jgi:elongation factor 1-alpha
MYKFMPITGFVGDNVTGKAVNLSWYSGRTLFATLDTLILPKWPFDRRLSLPVQRVYKISGFGTVPVGCAKSGIMRLWPSIVVSPAGIVANVKSIEMYHTEAVPGDNIGFSVKGMTAGNIRRGVVVGETARNPPASCVWLLAQMAITNDVGQRPSTATRGISPGVRYAHPV